MKYFNAAQVSITWNWLLDLKSPEFSWTPEALKASIEEHGVWGLSEQSQHIAESAFLVLAKLNSDTVEVLTCAVQPSYRKQGIMRRLLTQALEQTQFQECWLEVHQCNKAAIALYESLGFRQIGLRKNYYSDGASALLMTLKKEPLHLIGRSFISNSEK